MSLLTRDVVPSNAVTSTDHGALAKVASAFVTSITLTFLCTRLLIRWPWQQLVGMDDITTLVASLFGIVQMVLVFSAVSAGFGKMPGLLSYSEELKANKLIYASDIIYVLTMYLSRMAIICFFFRLEKSRTLSTFVKSLAVACAVLAPVSIIIVASSQHAGAWTFPSAANANGVLARWIVVEALGDLFDLAIIIYPIYLVSDLHMRTSMKFKVVLGVLFRFPIIAISILRLISLSKSLRSPTFLFSYIETEIYTQVEMGFLLISATVPTMRIFLRAAKSSLLGETVHTTLGGSYGSASRSGMFSGNNSKNATRDASRSNSVGAIELFNRTGCETVTRVTHGERGGHAGGNKAGSLASDASGRAIMLQHTVDVEVNDIGGEKNGAYGTTTTYLDVP